MSSRLRSLITFVAVVALAVPATALLLRVTTFFFADFNMKAGPGQTPPLAAEKGTIVAAAPVFTVLGQPTGGGALLITGTGPGTATATMDAIFEKVFSGSEIQVSWVMTPGTPCPNVTLRCMEDNDGEIIDVGWGGGMGSGGGGYVDVGDTPIIPLDDSQTYLCTLTLRDNLVGPDIWVFTITKPGSIPLTTTGLLSLSHPLVLTKLQLVVAGSSGTMLIDDLQVTSSSVAQSK